MIKAGAVGGGGPGQREHAAASMPCTCTGLLPGMRVLAEAGLKVTGLDYSAHLLKKAKTRGTGRMLRYVRGDMRALPAAWASSFDVVLNLFTSFGFFLDPADDARVIGIH